MLSNLHTHTRFCDGSAGAEELVTEAIEKGFVSLGFSAHAYAPYGTSYCIKDEDGYISEIKRLKKKYRDKIEIYLGIEEDAFHYADRKNYEYLIGSMHYVQTRNGLLPIDLGEDCVRKILDAFDGKVGAVANAYYGALYDYLMARRPDVVGHFDLLTKYDELGESYFLGKPEHDKIALDCVGRLAKEGFLFEVNTGAIARGMRKTPYPAPSLLREIKKQGGSIILNSDCHSLGNLDCKFKETKDMLRDIGFDELTVLCNYKFTKYKFI